jgi:hypothetical protein
MGSITSANAVLTLAIPLVFPTPQQLQGFAADDIFDVPALRSAEVQMGVDGVLSAGFVFVPVPQTLSLQADSASNDLFDTWWTQMQATKNTYQAQGLIVLPAIGKKYTLVQGTLTQYKPAPAGKRVLQPRQYEITWASINPSPV